MGSCLREASFEELPLDGDERRHILPKAKIRVPQTQTTQMERPQLVSRIAGAMREKRVVLVCAPAGFSKTVSLASAAARFSERELFWVSIDEGDTLARVLSALLAALDPIDVPWRLSRVALTGLATETETGPRYVADIFAQAFEATSISHGTIVLDDLHRVRDASVFVWLDHLIERLPDNWTIVLSSRQAPPISLTRLRFLRHIAEFTGDDLKFSLEEFQSLAAERSRTEPAESLAQTWEQVSGWPAACELALQVGMDKSAPTATGSAVFELLSNDVLSHLSARLQAFLMRCSILPELTEELCSAVTGDTDTSKLIREIRVRGLFVSVLSEEPLSLKLHDLFVDFLRTRLKEEYTKEDIQEFYRRAAVAESISERRINYLLSAGDLAEAEQAFANVAYELFLEGDRERVFGLAEQFPPDYAAKSAEIAFISGLCESSHSRWVETQRHMARAAKLYQEMQMPHKNRRARAHEVIAYIGLAMSEHAMGLLAELTREDLDVETKALCAFARYWISRVGGTVEMEMQSFDQMLELLLMSNDPVIWNECALHIYLGGQRGMRVRAERYATATLAIAGKNHDSLRDSAMSMRACHNLLVGEYQKAAEMIREIEHNQSWNGKPHSVRTFVYVAKGLLAFLEGNARELRENGALHLAEFSGREGISWAYWRGTTLIFLGKLHAALEDWEAMRTAMAKLDEELAILDLPYLRQGRAFLEILWQIHEGKSAFAPELIAAMKARPIVGDIVTLEPAEWIVLAIVHARRHEYEEAWRIIQEQVNELEASGESFHLILLGTQMLKMLINLPATGDFDRERKVLGELVAKLEATRKAAGEVSWRGPEGLTAREIEILEHIARGDSNKVIARVFGLSPHTVKRHVANILDKLQVNSRGQASAWYRANMHS